MKQYGHLSAIRLAVLILQPIRTFNPIFFQREGNVSGLTGQYIVCIFSQLIFRVRLVIRYTLANTLPNDIVCGR